MLRHKVLNGRNKIVFVHRCHDRDIQGFRDTVDVQHFLNCICFLFVCFFRKNTGLLLPLQRVGLCRMKEGILRVRRRPLLVRDEWVPQDYDDSGPAQELLGDVVVLVDRGGFLALMLLGTSVHISSSTASLSLSKGVPTAWGLLVVVATDEHLGVVLD